MAVLRPGRRPQTSWSASVGEAGSGWLCRARAVARLRVTAPRAFAWGAERRAVLLFRTLFDDGLPGLFHAAGARISKIIRSLPERRAGAHSV